MTNIQRTFVLAFGFMGLLINLLVICFAIGNAFRYLYKEGMTKRLIILFYFFTLLNTLANIAILVVIILTPETAISNLELNEEEEMPVLMIISATTNLALYLISGLSMYQFCKSIQMIL